MTLPTRLAGMILLALPALTAIAGAASLPPLSDVTAKTVSLPGGAQTTVDAALGQLTATLWRPAAVRPMYANVGLSDGVKASGMFRFQYQLAARGPMAKLRLCYGNFGSVGTSVEADGPYQITHRVALELNPANVTGTWPAHTTGLTIIPVFFKTTRSLTLDPGVVQACSDEIVYPFKPSQTIYVRDYVSVSGGSTFVTTTQVRSTAYESANTGFFALNSTSQASSTNIAFTIAPQSTTNASLLPLTGTMTVTGNGITGSATATCPAGTVTGTGITSGTVNCATGAFALTLASAGSGVYAVRGYGTANASDETLVASPQDLSYGATQGQGPQVIIGQLAPSAPWLPRGVCFFGDSILTGTGNAAEKISWGDYGFDTVATDLTTSLVGITKMTQPGDTIALFLSRGYGRLGIANGLCDEVITNYGTNDIGANATVSAIEASMLTEWSMLASFLPHGLKDLYQVLIFPRMTSAASNTAVTNYGTGSSVRNQVNAWICSQVGVTIGGVIDANQAIEQSPGTCTISTAGGVTTGTWSGNGTGLWTSSADTADGTHPSQSGHQKIGTYLGASPSATAPSPAFTTH